MPENGVIFSDGIESDYLNFNSGTVTTIGGGYNGVIGLLKISSMNR